MQQADLSKDRLGWQMTASTLEVIVYSLKRRCFTCKVYRERIALLPMQTLSLFSLCFIVSCLLACSVNDPSIVNCVVTFLCDSQTLGWSISKFHLILWDYLNISCKAGWYGIERNKYDGLCGYRGHSWWGEWWSKEDRVISPNCRMYLNYKLKKKLLSVSLSNQSPAITKCWIFMVITYHNN